VGGSLEALSLPAATSCLVLGPHPPSIVLPESMDSYTRIRAEEAQGPRQRAPFILRETPAAT